MQTSKTPINFKAIIYSIASCLLLFVFISFNSFKTEGFDNRGNFHFTGINSLYIEINNGLHFNWITTKKDIGIYELVTLDSVVIYSGKTNPDRNTNLPLLLLPTPP
jgi:hypothetical protein